MLDQIDHSTAQQNKLIVILLQRKYILKYLLNNTIPDKIILQGLWASPSVQM